MAKAGPLAEPKVIVGDVPIESQNFVWSFQVGTRPYITNFTVAKGPRNDALKAIQNPTKIEIHASGGISQFEERVIIIENVHLLQPKEIDPYSVTWEVADTRFSWRGKKMYCCYNKTRAKNEVSVFAQAGERDPAIIREPFNTFAVGRYLPWSVKSDGKPFTVLEILYKELEAAGIQYIEDIEEDKSYILENVEYEGIEFSTAMEELCARSRMQVGILPDGMLETFSLDFFDSNADALELLKTRPKTKPGILYQQEMKRLRPRQIIVKFEKKVETRIIVSTSQNLAADTPLPVLPHWKQLWTEEDIAARRVIGCENVICSPAQIYSNILGREFQIGEYVPVWAFLEALGLTETIVRTYWFAGGLEQYLSQAYTFAGGGSHILENYDLAAHVCGAIRSHYRRTFQIDPYYMNQIKSWEARRVAVIDNYSHYSPPSPLWVDYCIVPKLRIPTVAKGLTSWSTFATNWIADNYDPYRTKPTPGTIGVYLQALGIFNVNFPSDLTQVVQEIIPSAVDNVPVLKIAETNNIWANASLRAAYTLESIISVIWAADKKADNPYNFEKKYYPCQFTYSDGQGPEIEYLSKSEFARFPCKSMDESGNIISANVQEPVNLSIVNALANSEAAKLENQFKDRWVGFCTYPGEFSFTCWGNISAVRIILSPGGGLETEVDARGIPPAPQLPQTLPQSVINYLYKHVSRGDNASEVI